MKEEQKQKIQEKYQQAKQKGVKFYPDIIYKDLVVSFAIFLILIMLATFVGVANEPKADPNDSAYIPRPEWYFLFLFEMLKYFPGEIEWIGTAVLPAAAVLALFLLPFFDRNPNRHWRKRKFAVTFMSVIVIGMVALTILSAATTPPQEEVAIAGTISEQITLGEELYALQCVECHGSEGEGGEITTVEGLEGTIVKPINSQDEMYTRSDDTLFDIINYGQPNLGMPGYGRAYGGELGPGEIESIVTFMRYTWDDRVEIPAEATVGFAIPELAPGEIPSYEVHIAPIFKRYCVSCHRPDKENNNYLMQSYDEVMNSGDNAPNVVPGDETCNIIRMINREEIEAGGPMPPTKALKQEFIDLIILWVLGGAPNTAADAAAVSTGVSGPSGVLTTTITTPITAIPEEVATQTP